MIRLSDLLPDDGPLNEGTQHAKLPKFIDFVRSKKARFLYRGRSYGTLNTGNALRPGSKGYIVKHSADGSAWPLFKYEISSNGDTVTFVNITSESTNEAGEMSHTRNREWNKGNWKSQWGSTTGDFRKDYDDKKKVKDGVLYLQGNKMQIWWNPESTSTGESEKETWSFDNEKIAKQHFDKWNK